MLEHDIASPLSPSDDPIAVIVCHGMGQQAPFETLNEVVGAFIEAHQEQGWCVPGDDSVDFTKIAHDHDELLPYGKVTLTEPDSGERQKFHFYEVYWAPMTEGVVRFRDVILFLLKAGWDGFWAYLHGGKFSRYTFKEAHPYRLTPLTGILLGFAFLLLLSLVQLFGAFFAVIASDVLGHFQFPLAQHLPVERLRDLLNLFVLSLLLASVIPGLNGLIQLKKRDTTSQAARLANFINLIPLFISIILSGYEVAFILATRGQSRLDWWMNLFSQLRHGAFLLVGGPLLNSFYAAWPALVTVADLVNWLIFTGIGLVIFYGFYQFLVKSVGDVTAYVSAHAVNRFWRVRQEILARASAIGGAVYGRGNEQPHYKNVVVIGHSLGSVIAYDMLNSLISQDLSGNPAFRRIAARTRLFLTCGSPLNKIAFLFRYQAGGRTMPKWRELLNNYKQPLILAQDDRHRPQRWINISCLPDWISGELSYYELPTDKRTSAAAAYLAKAPERHSAPLAADRRIIERQDLESFLPLIAHVQYFKHQAFRDAIYEGLHWKHAGLSQPSIALSTAIPKRDALRKHKH